MTASYTFDGFSSLGSALNTRAPARPAGSRTTPPRPAWPTATCGAGSAQGLQTPVHGKSADSPRSGTPACAPAPRVHPGLWRSRPTQLEPRSRMFSRRSCDRWPSGACPTLRGDRMVSKSMSRANDGTLASSQDPVGKGVSRRPISQSRCPYADQAPESPTMASTLSVYAKPPVGSPFGSCHSLAP